MAELPTDKDRDARVSLADAVDRRQTDIQRRFRDALEARTRGVQRSPLGDVLHDFLGRVAQELRGSAPVSTGARSAWRELAEERGLLRVADGFDVERLLNELSALRRATLDSLGDAASLRQATLLAEIFEAAMTESVRRYVDARDREARRMRASAPRVPSAAVDVTVKIAEVALGDLLGDALAVARGWAEDKGIPLLARFDPEVVLRVDAALALAALKIVLGNAVKFTDEGGVTVDAEDRAEDLVIHVRDNCDGLSAEELATVFEPFPRRHSRKPGGGTSLATARRVLTAQGGSLSASSDGDRGCHFQVSLPKARH